MIQIHGTLLPVIDLRLLRGPGQEQPLAAAAMIVLEKETARIALQVDEVSEVGEIAVNSLKEPGPASDPWRASCVKQVCEWNGRPRAILSVEALFDQPKGP